MSEKTPVAVEKKHLTPADYAAIRERAELGETIAALAEEYGISRQNLSQYFKRHGITVGSRKAEVSAAVGAAVTAKAVETVTYSAQRNAWIEEHRVGRQKDHKFMLNVVKKTIGDCIKAGVPFSAKKEEFKTIGIAWETLQNIYTDQADNLDVKGHVDEKDLPQIVFRDLSLEDLAKQVNDSDDDIDLSELIPEDTEPGADDDALVVEGS